MQQPDLETETTKILLLLKTVGSEEEVLAAAKLLSTFVGDDAPIFTNTGQAVNDAKKDIGKASLAIAFQPEDPELVELALSGLIAIALRCKSPSLRRQALVQLRFASPGPNASRVFDELLPTTGRPEPGIEHVGRTMARELFRTLNALDPYYGDAPAGFDRPLLQAALELRGLDDLLPKT